MLSKAFALLCFAAALQLGDQYSAIIFDPRRGSIRWPRGPIRARVKAPIKRSPYLNAAAGQFYFQVSIQEKNSRTALGTHLCGAVIIRKDLVLLPATCLFSPNVQQDRIVDRAYLSKFHAIAGLKNSKQFLRVSQRVGLKELRRLAPPGNQPKSHAIAIGVVFPHFRFNNYVKPIPLTTEIFANWTIVTGWRNYNTGAKRLQFSQTKIRQINREDCLNHVKEIYNLPIENDVVCKRPYQTETPLCYGDLGTAVIQRTANRSYSLVGMNLWGKYWCDEPDTKLNFLFETTTRYTLWIQEQQQLIKVK